MLLREVIELYDILDDPSASAAKVKDMFLKEAPEFVTLRTEKAGGTEFIRISVPALSGGVPTLGIIGRLGGVGARPAVLGFVSDGDGALSVLAAALKAVRMAERGERFPVNLLFVTHIDPDAPVRPHKPVPFMGSCISSAECNRYELDPCMDLVISVDTTKGNRVVNHTGIAVTPTVKDGVILPVSGTLLDIASFVTGEAPYVLPLSQQDITPYANQLYHINSIMQPAVATSAPVVGLAITSSSVVPGCASGASRYEDVEAAARFLIETAKRAAEDDIFYDKKEYRRFIELYGDGNKRFQA